MKGKVFTAQEVQSIIAGNKTMFREVIKPKINLENYSLPNECGMELLLSECPYQVGQKIFCKESFWQFGGYDGGSDGDEARFIGSNKITFCPEEADKTQTLCKAWKKRPAQQMKKEHSRLTLQIKDIRVEKLKDISDEDCEKEGINPKNITNINNYFRNYWNATHKKPEEKFEVNPWVWCVSFEIINN